MAARLTITAQLDDPRVRAAFAHWRRLGADPQPLLRSIGVGLTANTRDRFMVGRDPDGNAWAPLSPAYAPIKRGGGILRASGLLMGSITFETAGHELAVGSNRIYAGVHQFGATIRAKAGGFLRFQLAQGEVTVRSVTIPARPYLGIGPEDEDTVLDATEAFYLRFAPGAGPPA